MIGFRIAFPPMKSIVLYQKVLFGQRLSSVKVLFHLYVRGHFASQVFLLTNKKVFQSDYLERFIYLKCAIFKTLKE